MFVGGCADLKSPVGGQRGAETLDLSVDERVAPTLETLPLAFSYGAMGEDNKTYSSCASGPAPQPCRILDSSVVHTFTHNMES